MAEAARKPNPAPDTAGDPALERSLGVALAESRRRYKDLVEISSDFAWETGPDGAFVFVSPRGALGYSAEALVGRPAAALLLEPGHAGAIPFTARAPVERAEIWCGAADGTLVRLECSGIPLLDAAGGWNGARGVARDVTEERAAAETLARLRNRERLHAHVLGAIWEAADPSAMLGAATTATMRALSADAAALWHGGAGSGYRLAARAGLDLAGELVDHLPEAFPPGAGPRALSLGQNSALAAPTRCRDAARGAIAIVRAPGRPAFDADETALFADLAFQIGIATAHVANHEALDRLSRIDGLTGLLVRRAFVDALAGRLDRPGALLYLDLDNFKPVNDRFGHAAGDAVLKRVAARLARVSGTGGLAARLGGDEFALWLADVDEDGALAAARSLVATMDELDRHSADAERPLGLSIGVALHDHAGDETLDHLLARADAAMYAVKHASKGDVALAPKHSEGAP